MALRLAVELTGWKQRKAGKRGKALLKNFVSVINTLRTGDADLRFYVTTVQDG